MKKPKSISEFIDSKPEWKEPLEILRELFESTPLKGVIKWGMPVYSWDNRNVAGFNAFKSYTGIWFFQGVFLEDTQKKLVSAQGGVTRAQRQWRFGSTDEILQSRDLILEYLEEATRNARQGREIKPERRKTRDIPEAFRKAILADSELKKKFLDLTPAKKREYLDYILEAKREETRQKRLERIRPMILRGEGLNDRYQ